MADSNLQVLAVHRDALLLAEVAAWLHDIGKCTSEFAYLASARSKNNFDPYKAVFTAGELQQYQFSAQRIQERLDEANQQYALHTLLDPKTLQSLDASFDIDRQRYTYREAIYFSRPRFAGNIGRPLGRLGEPLDLLAYCHGEGHVEKGEPFPQVLPQVIARHSAFGFAIAELPKPDETQSLTTRLNSLDWGAVVQRQETKALRQLFSEALGDTRSPINEVTLWDWSYAVATLYKSELARHFLTGEWRTRNDLRWRVLRVNFDVLGLYAKAVKIGDLLGYQRAVEQACEAVKKLVEEEYPLGNEIYRDSTGIYFTFPDLDLPADLAQEIRRRVEEVEMELSPRIAVVQGDGSTATEQLKGILGKARGEAHKELAQPFDSQNLSACWQQQWQTVGAGKWEICPVCGLQPMQEGAEACATCLQRRDSRIEAWKSNPQQTIWLDEIADHNDRVALIVGKFGLDDWLSGDLVQTMLVRAIENDPGKCVPKNLSPARLRRVWETCQRFWTETVDGILNQHPYANGMANAALRRARVALVPDPDKAWREGIPYDGTINGQAISLFWLREENHFVTISNLQLAAGKAQDLNELVAEWHGKTVHVVASDRLNERKEFTIARVNMLTDAKCGYTPSLPLLSSPDQFLALVPTAEALDIAERIKSEYEKQMGKVRNRLPLFLGLVFFQRKMPLAAVMDTARRMLDGVKLGEEAWQIECSCPSEDHQTRHLRLAKDQARIIYDVPLKMGDGTTDDTWYPYFFVEQFVDGTPDDRAYRFQHNGRWLVHVNDLREGDVVRVTPSRFAYLFLESTAQRFRFNPAREVMLLDELPCLMKMWQDVCKSPEMSDTRLQAIHALFESRWQAWDLDEAGADSTAFRHLVETTRKRDKIRGVTVDDVVNGRFRRCLDLYLHVLKRRVSDEKKQEEHDERQFETANA